MLFHKDYSVSHAIAAGTPSALAAGWNEELERDSGSARNGHSRDGTAVASAGFGRGSAAPSGRPVAECGPRRVRLRQRATRGGVRCLQVLAPRPYTRGLHDLGNGCFAWLLPNGSWGWSNAGLVTDGGEALLVDTLFDLKLTAEMLTAMRDAAPRTRIGTVVNTHANGDHCYGNSARVGCGDHRVEGVGGADGARHPARPVGVARALRSEPGRRSAATFFNALEPSTSPGSSPRSPRGRFPGALTLQVGSKRVELLEVGPAHTAGDVIVHVPDDRTVFTGDILFVDGTPIVWAGPVERWIDACTRILAMDVETVVPGHGPITDKRGVLAVKKLPRTRARAKPASAMTRA